MRIFFASGTIYDSFAGSACLQLLLFGFDVYAAERW